MKKTRKLFLITLVLLSLVLTISLVGCGTSEETTQQTTTTTTATSSPVETSTASVISSTTSTQTSSTPVVTTTSEAPATTEQMSPGLMVADKAVKASAGVTTFKMDMDMVISTETIGGEAPGRMDMETSIFAEMDIPGEQMKLVMDMVMDIPEMGEQTISTSTYLIDEWMYTMVNIPGFGDQWVKMKYDEMDWEQQDQFDLQVEFLKTALGATLLSPETVDGVLCDVILLEPDMNTLAAWAMAQQSDESAAQLAGVDLADVFKTYSVKYWIAQDSSLPIKCEMIVVMEMTPEDMGDSSAEFDTMTMEMNATVLFYDYGEAVDIVLPPEAAGAIEIDSD